MNDKRRKIFIVAPELPTGLSWLLNILLELSIKTHRSDAEEFWKEESGTSQVQPMHREVMRWLPALSRKPHLTFPEPLSFQWLHIWPREDVCRNPFVFYFRSGFDAVYSQYKRHNAGLSFLTYLRSPLHTEGAPYPVMLNLTPQDTWAFYGLLWKRLAPAGSQWFQFEDMRKDPVRDVSRLLGAFGIQRSPNEIQRAIDESTFEKAKAAEDKYLKEHPEENVVRINRSGKVGEWKETFGDRERACFAGLPAMTLKEFGYVKEHEEVMRLAHAPGPIEPVLQSAIKELRSGTKSFQTYAVLAGHAATPLEALSYGRILAAARWYSETVAGTETEKNAAFARALRTELTDLTQYLALTPLNLTTFARSLADAGHTAQATKLLSEFLQPSAVSFLEAFQLGRLYRKMGQKKESRSWLKKAGSLLEGDSGARLYAWCLMEDGDWGGARVFLASARKIGWTLLLARKGMGHFKRKLS